MKTHNAQIDALSDEALNAVTGGKKERVEVTKEQYEQILAARFLLASLNK
jgi:hypothetical protein